MIIGTTSEDDAMLLSKHLEDVRKVLSTLAKHEILVNPKKVQMFMRQVEFCGHILSEGKRRLAPSKLMAVQKWEVPKTVTQLRGFLGLTNYYSTYVKNYAHMAGPLIEATTQAGRW